MSNIKKVFLGGTVTGVDPLYGWRGKIIPMLKIDYFNPVMKSWNKAAIEEEYNQKNNICDYGLFVITPEIRGYFSIAEAVDFSNKRPAGTIFCVLDETFENAKKFSPVQAKSLNNVGNLIKRNGGQFFNSLEQVANYLNK